MRRDLAQPGRDVELRHRIKDGDETPRHHVENFRFRVIEIFRLGSGRDDREVIADLRVVEDALVEFDPIVFQHLLRVRLERAAEVAERLPNDGKIIFRQGARIGSRISQHLVLLVKRLRDLQGALGRETEATVGFALERREVVKPRRDLRAAFLFLGNRRHRLALAGGDDALGRVAFPEAIDPIVLVVVLFEIGALIDAFVIPFRDLEFPGDPPVVARVEIPDLEFTGVNHRQRRSLHASDRSDVAGARTEHAFRDRAGAVDPDQPIALAPGAGGVGQALHLGAVAQALKAFADRLRRHRLEPEALDRMLVLRQLAEVGENQFAFAAGVAGVDDFVDVFARDQLLERGEFAFRILARFELKFFRDDRQGLEPPEAVFLFVDVLRHEELDDMADGGGDDILVVLEVVAVLGDFAERARDVRGDARFFGNDEGFGHEGMPTRPRWPGLQVGEGRSGLGKFHEILPRQLFDQPFQFEPQQDRGNGRGRKFARRRDLVDRGLGRPDRVVNEALVVAQFRERPGRGLGELLFFREKNLQVIENVARVHDQLGALLDEAVGTVRGRGVDVAGDGVNRTALLDRLRGGDERAAVQPGFDDEDAVAPAADDAVAHREGLAIGLDRHRKLGNDRAVPAPDFFGEGGVFRRIKFR